MAERQGAYALCSHTPLPLRIIAFSSPQVYTFCTPFPDLILKSLHHLSQKVRLKIPIHPSHTVRFMPFSYTFRANRRKQSAYKEKAQTLVYQELEPILLNLWALQRTPFLSLAERQGNNLGKRGNYL